MDDEDEILLGRKRRDDKKESLVELVSLHVFPSAVRCSSCTFQSRDLIGV